MQAYTKNPFSRLKLQSKQYLLRYVKNLDQYDRPRVLGCEPVDGVLVVLSSNQINIATFVNQMGDIQGEFDMYSHQGMV